MSHTARIWDHLKQFNSISEEYARNVYGCKRLSARIEDLRREHGVERIRTVYRKEKSKTSGKMIRFTDYYELVAQREIDAPSLGL